MRRGSTRSETMTGMPVPPGRQQGAHVHAGQKADGDIAARRPQRPAQSPDVFALPVRVAPGLHGPRVLDEQPRHPGADRIGLLGIALEGEQGDGVALCGEGPGQLDDHPFRAAAAQDGDNEGYGFLLHRDTAPCGRSGEAPRKGRHACGIQAVTRRAPSAKRLRCLTIGKEHAQ